MELATILEEIASLPPGLAEPPAPPAVTDDEDDTTPVTGYELDDSDWEALGIVADGRGDFLDESSIAWLRTCGLVEDGDPPRLTPFAIEWRGWDK